MSKSLGNSPDLLALIDQYGADAARFGIMIASPAGNDILFDEASLEQGRNFNNKIWNALKLLKMWEAKLSPAAETQLPFAVQWFEQRLNEVSAEVNEMMDQFRLSESLKTIYSLIWDDFCSWYLEWVKPGFEQSMDKSVYDKTVSFFTELMHLLHPFMPFVTEEIYHQLADRKEDLCVRQHISREKADVEILQTGLVLKNTISGLRDVRNKQQIKPKESISLFIQTENEFVFRSLEIILLKQVNASVINYTKENIPGSFTTVIGKDTFYIMTEKPADTEGQRSALLKELDYMKGFLLSVDKKLGNEKFVQNARPDVIELERKKKADAEAKIKVMEESLASLNR